MAKVERIGQVQATLRRLGKDAQRQDGISAVTSYSTNYALYVHEALDVHHDVGQAKYLEQPARQLANDGTLAGIVVRVYTATRDLGKSLLATMLRVQRDSQKLVPVDTGTLKNSAQTQLEGRR